MRKSFLWFIKAAAAGLLALALLCLWCSFYFNVPVHYENPTGATEYVWQSDKFYRKGTEGFAFGRTNNEGFNNLEDYTPGQPVDILLMGSSHMEGFNVPQEDNAAAVLNRLFDGKKYTYNIGTSGHTLMYCMKHLEAALDNYSPSGYVLMETRTLDFTMEELRSTAQGELVDIASHSGGIMEALQKLPYLRLMYTKYFNSGDNDEQSSAPAAELDRMEYAGLISQLTEQAAESCADHGVKGIIIYDPTVYADEKGEAYTMTKDWQLELMEESCREAGLAFVDLTESYLNGYEQYNRLPYGFLNTAPGTGHMNSWGHELFAQEVYAAIAEMEG